MSSQQQFLPVCPVCELPVALESSKADEHGRAVHEDCYILNINLHDKTLPRRSRPWREIARELAAETNRRRALELAEELNRAMSEQMDRSALPDHR